MCDPGMPGPGMSENGDIVCCGGECAKRLRTTFCPFSMGGPSHLEYPNGFSSPGATHETDLEYWRISKIVEDFDNDHPL